MSVSASHDTAAGLRGSLRNIEFDADGAQTETDRGPGARGIERIARNQRCLRLTALAFAGLNPVTVATRVHGAPDWEGSSPFAADRGNRFEKSLYASGAEKLITALRDSGVWDADRDPEIANIAEMSDDMQERVRITRKLVHDRAAGQDAPDVLIHPRFEITALDGVHQTEPDLLIGRPGRFYDVAEVKSYADRHGYTDQAKTGSAARQAAVGWLALQEVFADLTGPGAPRIRKVAHLIFARRGGNWPSLTTVPISGEILSISNALTNSPQLLPEILRIADGRTFEDPRLLADLPNNLCGDCSSHCALWLYCRAEATQADEPITLGDTAAEVLASASGLTEAVAWTHGKRTPADADARKVAVDLRRARDAWLSAEDAAPPTPTAWQDPEDEPISPDEATAAEQQSTMFAAPDIHVEDEVL